MRNESIFILCATLFMVTACGTLHGGLEAIHGGGRLPDNRAAAQTELPGYLGCYEMPAVTLSGESSVGDESFGDTQWQQFDTGSADRKIITHTYSYGGKQYRNYTAMIDREKRCPVWTAYTMHKGSYPNNDIGRVGTFSQSTSYDPGIPRSWQSSGSTSDYNHGNGYARGHHCASEDRQVSVEANRQTFYYTNQSPQWQNSFNAGIWASLEASVQNNAPSSPSDSLYVVVGTLFENGNSGPSNDGGEVSRPSHFYKCLMLCSFDSSGTMTAARGTAYIFANEAHSGAAGDIAAYITTIDAIEARSGFDFFTNVPAILQEAAEALASPLW